MVTYNWMPIASKIRELYNCPENCSVCCRNGIFRFTGREYRRVLSVLKPEKRDAIEAVVVDVSEEQINNEMVGMPKSITDNLIQVGLKHFATDVCPLLEGNKCSVESAKFILCRTYPFQGDDVQKHGSIDIIPCPVGLEIMYDFAGMHLYGKQIAFGSLKDAPLLKDDLQYVLNCYNDRMTPDCKEPVDKVIWKLSTHISALQKFTELCDKTRAIIHSIGGVVKRTIESCAGMQEVDDKAIEDCIKKGEEIIAKEGQTSIKIKVREPFTEATEGDFYFNKFNIEGAYKKMRKELLWDIECTLASKENCHSMFNQTIFVSSILQAFPILQVDSVLDPLVVNTNLSESADIEISENFDFKLPYPAMFVDKVFKSGDNKYILGVAIFDLVFLEHWLKEHTVSFEKYKIKIDEDDNLCICNLDVGVSIPTKIEEDSEFSNDTQKIVLFFVEAEVDKIGHLSYSTTSSSIENILNIVQGKPVFQKRNTKQPLSEDCIFLEEIEDTRILKDVLKYVFNICFLINNHVNPKYPASKHEDFRLLPEYRDARSKRANISRFSVLKVFGETKQKAEEFNRLSRQYRAGTLKATPVRGHYRHYRHIKYRQELRDNVQGQWIPPYFKGEGRELMSRIVKLEP